MERNNKGLNWFTNLFKEIEDQCLEMYDFVEKEVLKYVEGQEDSVGGDEENLDVKDDPPENEDDTFPIDPEKHHVPIEGQTIQSGDEQDHPIMEPNHLSGGEEISEAEKVEKENATANIRRSKPKQSQEAGADTEEGAKLIPSIIHDDDFPDWEIY